LYQALIFVALLVCILCFLCFNCDTQLYIKVTDEFTGRLNVAAKQRGWNEQQEVEIRQLFERFEHSAGL